MKLKTLSWDFKSEKMKDMKDKPREKVIRAAMDTKMNDEIHHHYELKKRREQEKEKLGEQFHKRPIHTEK